jgi:hypothetical protein
MKKSFSNWNLAIIETFSQHKPIADKQTSSNIIKTSPQAQLRNAFRDQPQPSSKHPLQLGLGVISAIARTYLAR